MANFKSRLKQKYDTSSNWTSNNPILLQGEIGIESDTNKFKFGNGTDNWNSLEYVSSNINLEEIIGTEDDTYSDNTIYGVKSGIEEIRTELNNKIDNIAALDNSIEISGDKTKEIKVKISNSEDNALKLTENGLKVELGVAPEYTIEKELTPSEDSVSSYVLKKNGIQSGVKIDIPKDYLVKSASIKESIGEKDPSSLPVGTKYIDFVINAKDAKGTESHIYLNVNELVDAYVPGNGIEIESSNNTISAKIVAENGLSIDASGIKLAVASAETNGAMSSTHFSKLEGIAANAQVNIIEEIQTNGEKIEPSGKTINIPLATTTKVGLVKVDNTSIEITSEGALSIKTVNIKKLIQDPEDVLILDCGASI